MKRTEFIKTPTLWQSIHRADPRDLQEPVLDPQLPTHGFDDDVPAPVFESVSRSSREDFARAGAAFEAAQIDFVPAIEFDDWSAIEGEFDQRINGTAADSR
jgi:hypothetical protein